MSNLNNMDIDEWCKDAIAQGGRNGRLEWATANGLTETVVTIIEQNNININEKHGDEQYTLLHIAAMNDYPDTANALIKKGAGPDAQDKDGKTPLHFAAERGYQQVVQALLDKGADVNIKDKNEKTPLNLATDEEIQALLRNAKNPGDGSVDKPSTDNEENSEEDAGTQQKEKQEGNVQPGSDITGQNSDNTEPQAEGVKAVAPTEPAQTEEQPSSFFGSLFSILMKPFSLIGSFFSDFFSWLFGSDEPTQSPPESDQQVVLEPPNNPGDNDII